MSHFCDIYNWISWKVIFFFFASVPFNNHCKNLRWMLATSIILQDEKFLIWYSGQREKQLRLSSVTKIVTGQRTVCSKCDFLMWILLVILHHTDALFIYMLVNYLWQINFQRQLQPDRELQSFSLIYANGECSLDLVIKLVGPFAHLFCFFFTHFNFPLSAKIGTSLSFLYYLFIDMQGQSTGWFMVYWLESCDIEVSPSQTVHFFEGPKRNTELC